MYLDLPSPLIRAAFVRLMGLELEANAHKGDWSKWKPDAKAVITELLHHVEKLNAALNGGDAVAVSEHAADVANIVMKADEIHGVGGAK